MGLKENTEGNGTMVSIISGKWTVRVEEGAEGSVARKLTKGPNTGSTVWEKYYPTIEGMLTSLAIRTSEFGENAYITMTDPECGDDYTLSIPTESRMLLEFTKRLGGVDPSEPVELTICKDKEKVTGAGNPVYYLLLKQGGQILKPLYTRAEPNGMPEAKKTRKGWDFSEQEDFLIEVLGNWFAENCTLQESANAPDTKGGHVDPSIDDDDDVPF